MRDEITTYIETELRDMGEDVRVDPDVDLSLIGFDSIAYVRLIVFIRQRYGIRVPEGDVTVENFGTVDAIADYLEQLEAAAGSGLES